MFLLLSAFLVDKFQDNLFALPINLIGSEFTVRLSYQMFRIVKLH